jgi:hypothetical protein
MKCRRKAVISYDEEKYGRRMQAGEGRIFIQNQSRRESGRWRRKRKREGDVLREELMSIIMANLAPKLYDPR